MCHSANGPAGSPGKQAGLPVHIHIVLITPVKCEQPGELLTGETSVWPPILSHPSQLPKPGLFWPAAVIIVAFTGIGKSEQQPQFS